MPKIHLLDDEMVNVIAAGEVVERPVSVVKELVENALDAGAKKIHINLEKGGTQLIAVTDDGCGMSSEDARLSVVRHATSKIKTAEELFAIQTMGFRGEALASIAAVSRFSIATVPQGAAEGVKLILAEGQDVVEHSHTGSHGTTVVVEDLFQNLPARAKFLKAAATEYSHVVEFVQGCALVRSDCTFILHHNGKETMHVAAIKDGATKEQCLRQRATAIFGEKQTADLLYVEDSSAYGSVCGLISPPGTEKSSGKFIHTFVNGRFVKDKVLRYGVLRGYHSHLLKGRFPFAIVCLEIDPALVDVNVHPAKTEVRFQYPGEVQTLMAKGIRQVLRQGAWSASPVSPESGSLAQGSFVPENSTSVGHSWQGPRQVTPHSTEFSGAPSSTAGFSSEGRQLFKSTRRRFDGQTSGDDCASESTDRDRDLQGQRHPVPGATLGAWGRGASEPASATMSTRSNRLFDDDLSAGPMTGREVVDDGETLQGEAGQVHRQVIPWQELDYLGTFAHCYLMFSDDDRLLVVDQHAFHERILFERLQSDESLLNQSQKLLVPEAVRLSPTDMETLRSRQSELSARGFDLRFVPNRSSSRDGSLEVEVEVEVEAEVEVHALPSLLMRRDPAALLQDLAAPDEAEEPSESNASLGRLILATAACHGAVRAGEELGDNELKRLLAEASQVDFYHNCPHGRRVFRWWTRDQVGHWFDR